MAGPRAPIDLWASCAPGLEPWLEREIRQTLGVDDARVEIGGVAWAGDTDLAMRANLELGLATHVLGRVGQVRARAFPELVRKVERLPWGAWLRPDVPRRVLATSQRSRLYHTEAIAERVTAAIDAALGPGPSLEGSATEPVTVVARFVRDACTLSVDTSGEPLHRRGWRLQTAKAPLREDLARALLVVSGWDPSTPLVDPMMGAGTIAIEAACLARGLAPGLDRDFAIERTALADPDRLRRHRDRLRASARPRAPAPIVGRDRIAGALTAADGNATRAGVRDDVTLELADVRSDAVRVEGSRGAFVTNPPYGKRVRPEAGVAEVLAGFGARVRERGPQWTAAIVVPTTALARATGLPLRSVARTDHGGTKVQLYVTGDEP